MQPQSRTAGAPPGAPPFALKLDPAQVPTADELSARMFPASLAVSVGNGGKVFLQSSEVPIDELVPKLKAIAAARGGSDERIYVRGDKSVDYGTVMKVMGRLNAAGFRKVALVTEVEQGL